MCSVKAINMLLLWSKADLQNPRTNCVKFMPHSDARGLNPKALHAPYSY